MIKTYCDKCGKELNTEENPSPIEIKYRGLFGGHTRVIDLCWECKKEFENYVNKYFDGEDLNERN